MFSFQIINLLVLYGWFLLGLYSVNQIDKNFSANNSCLTSWLQFAAFFLGPIGLILSYVYLHKDFLFKIFNRQKSNSDSKYVNVIFLDEHGNNLFANRVENSEVLETVKKIIYDAITSNASDIFIDPKENASFVRMRVDGMIRLHSTLMGDESGAAIGIIKVAANMDIAEKRRPQDGSFAISIDGIKTSFRVATVGVYGGEKITIRVIASENTKRDLKDVGLNSEQLRIVNSGIKLPSGMVLICGPTGSGKTSTLYAMLDSIDYDMKNVISIEDPIERVIPKISQMEVNTKAMITFASLLRNSLRQNPDVICIGEIRDNETAEIAAHAAQTGHLILATLHSNDNIGTLVRMTDLGVPLRSIAACLHLIISQRLLRKICPHCRVPAQLTPDQLRFCQQYDIPTENIFTATGCPQCDHTGYLGRKAVFELMPMTNELRAIMEEPAAKITSIQDYINQHQGEQSIFYITRQMLLKGEISLDEFERVNISM